MLKIAKLEIAGFKSFSEPTEVVFPDGITAVVGPNGCGKSNIGDALNWVLGEQSARLLRGSSMQDVIFNGSETRKAVGMAEVSLQLRGRTGGDGVESKSVTITRRLFRDGESEYLVDGARSRLKDIQDLLREERVGAQTYATIEQGRIDQILNAKPKDRRLIIEEAAGVSGFKHKRRLAELKLEATQANLLRVNDIVVEVTRQINALKRQAAKARRYGRLRDELRAKESIRFGARARALDARLAEVRAAEAEARDAEAAAVARLAALDAEITAERAAVAEVERAAREGADALHRLDVAIERGEAQVGSCRERIAEAEEAARRLGGEIGALDERRAALAAEAEVHAAALGAEEAAFAEETARLEESKAAVRAAAAEREARRGRVEALQRDLLASTARLAELRNLKRAVADAAARSAAQRERLAQDHEAARAEHLRTADEAAGRGAEALRQRRSVEELREALGRAETEVGTAREAHARAQADLAASREAETSAASALRTLEDVATRFAGVSDGVRLLLTAGGAAGVRTGGVVADFVQAAREVEGAAEAYLQGFLPAVVVEDDADASKAAELIRREGAGRTVFVCKTQPPGALAVGAPANGQAPIPEAMRADPRVLGRFKDRITLRSGDGFVSQRIGDAVLVDTLDSALALHRVHPQVDYVAATGEVVYASGVIAAGGRSAADRGLLAHNRKIAEARGQLAEAAAQASAAAARVQGATSALAAAESALAELRRALEIEGKRGAELELLARRTEDDRERAERRLDLLAQEIEVARLEAERIAGELAAAVAGAAAAEAAHAEIVGGLEEATATLERAEAVLAGLVDDEAARRAETARREQRVEAARRERDRYAESLADVGARRDAAAAEREAATARGAEARALLAATEAELAEQWASQRRLTLEATAREEALTERRAALEARDTALRATREEVEGVRQRAQEREVARTALEADRRHLDDLSRQELGMTASEAASAAGEEALETADETALEAAVAEIRSKIDAIGAVNLTAIDEFQALEERHGHLATQKKDLEDAIASLRESIRRINRQSRERFVEAFEAIREHYREIFKVLFGGGRADLVLEEGEDVLECGIEMIVQPPGKRLGHVTLMSGGEKSMAALALLFAIFRYRPSPFCLLDEVDAALDELNVGRFTRMLSEYAENTQFILITHNKRSMEAARLLYGVTMQEAGVSKLVSLQL